MEIWQIIPAIYALIAVCVFIFIARKPKFFWLFFVCITVGTAGLIMIPKTPYCVALVDELLTAAVIGGAVLALILKKVKIVKKSQTKLEQIHWALFFILAGYMLFQSIRGLVLWQDILLLRWICFYVLIIAAAFLTSNTDLPAPKKSVLIRAILWSWTVYLLAYLLHGFIIQYFFGISYLSLTVQGLQWAGPNGALLPAIVTIPAALLYLRKGFGGKQWLGWAVLILTLVAGYVYESRGVFGAIAIYIIISPTILGLRKVIPVGLIGVVSVMLFYWEKLALFVTQMFASATFSYAGDAGRLAIVRASIDAICQRVDTFFFGYGINSHHYVLAPFMKAAGHPTVEMSPDYSLPVLPGQNFVYNSLGGLPDYVRVTGFGSLLTDIGIIGAILFAAVFFVSALRLIAMVEARGRFAMLASLGLIICWLFFSKIEDIVLIWFMIMPSGLALMLAKDKDDGQLNTV
ncbi:MAG: hypothetical protein L7H18_04380 [Candidatus Nealsonbacteria bacterium DGGOD1a]|nr:MAG: hypothetical protein L7H18_04380 [Candidatus Nealsonbacteria bacterium DGGOD1a]